jgi:hypothetical protein
MKQLTIRGFDPELERRLNRLARRHHLSLNKAVLLLLRRGAGLDEGEDRPPTVGSSLDHFIGSWSKGEERGFLAALRDLDPIDESFWRGRSCLTPPPARR